MKETTGAVTAMPRDESDVTGSISPIPPNMEIRIVDENWYVCALLYHSIVCYAVFLFQLTAFRISNLVSLVKFLFVDRLLSKAIMTIQRRRKNHFTAIGFALETSLLTEVENSILWTVRR